MTARLLIGDVRERIKEIPDGSVDLVCTSPPFLALRKYGDNADAEMGSEPTPAAFLDALLELTGEFGRVLAPHGSIAVELGDTYSGSGGAGGDYMDSGLREGQPAWTGASGAERRSRSGSDSGAATSAPRTSLESSMGVDAKNRGNTSRGTARRQRENRSAWPLAKSLCLIPTLYPACLAYGANLLNGEAVPAWRVRNVITWCRPNPPVGALGDKARPATSYITVACKGAKRWFDLDAVRVPSEDTRPRNTNGPKSAEADGVSVLGHYENRTTNPAGAPPLDWWDDALDPNDPTDHMTLVLPTQPYKGAHYAVWPATLARRLIEMMCPLEVCQECGKPRERIVDTTYTDAKGVPAEKEEWSSGMGAGMAAQSLKVSRLSAVPETLGWTDCGHGAYRRGVVLDPFAGSGTTLAVAEGCGRDAVGIELYESHADLVRERCGMFLEVVA